MTAPALAKSFSGRRYTFPPPPEDPELDVPSVTTIIGVMDKPALKSWVGKSVAEYAVDNVNSWVGLPREDAIDLLKNSPWRYTRRKADIGSMIHDAIDASTRGEVVELDDEHRPRVAGVLSFLERNVSEILAAECTLFHATLGYAGTADMFVRLKSGKTACLDWKTGKGVYGEVALQLAAYSRAEFMAVQEGAGWVKRDVPDCDFSLCCHLPESGGLHVYKIDKSEEDWEGFRACCDVLRWQEARSRNWYSKKVSV